jgi:hypothetical protein
MRKNTKRLILIVSIAAFFVLSFITVTYALGYKYDLIKNQFIKTGSLGITANTSGEIYLNNKLVGTTSFIGNKFSIRRLLPRTYDLRLQNEEYQSWQKLVKVEAGFFADFPKIVLVLKNPAEETIASDSLNFWGAQITYFDSKNNQFAFGNKQKIELINLKNGEKTMASQKEIAVILKGLSDSGKKSKQIQSPDENKLIIFDGHEIKIKWLKNSDHQPYKNAGDTLLVTRFSQDIVSTQWYKDSEHIIADVGGILKFIEIDTRGNVNISDIGTSGDGQTYYSSNLNSVFKISGNKLTRIDFEK